MAKQLDSVLKQVGSCLAVVLTYVEAGADTDVQVAGEFSLVSPAVSQNSELRSSLFGIISARPTESSHAM